MLETIIALMMEWVKVFPREKTAARAMRQAISQVCVIGRRTIARSYLARSEKGDWSSEYKLHSRSKWQAGELFEPLLAEVLCNWYVPRKIIALGCDDTRTKKTGKKIVNARWGRDPLSPPFHVNLQYGLRYLHISLLLPLHQRYGVSARALPVAFAEAPVLKKPGKKASEEEKKVYLAEKKKQNLNLQAVSLFQQMRKQIDDLGYNNKILAWALDGSFCNKTIFQAELERAILIARTRKDATLCFPATAGRKTYGEKKFTPEQVLKDNEIAWQSAEIFHGGKWRKLSYKEVDQVLWQRGAGEKPLRLIVIEPTPYRKTKKGKLLYRDPAFLLTTDRETPASELVQIYFDRWQMEVAHKELKDNFGLGQAMVRNPNSVPKQPALQVATYSFMHWAALQAFGPHRPDQIPLPKYQREKSRASAQDLIRICRHEVINHPERLPFDFNISAISLFNSATL